jgi:hypothetical protein
VTFELATSSYRSFDAEMGIPVAASLGRPKWPLRYTLEHEARRLAPWGLFDVKDPAEFTRRYRERLDRLDLDALVAKFEAISAQHGGRRVVLLCFEDLTKPGEFCHRRVFADFWQERTGQPVPELAENGALLDQAQRAEAKAQSDLARMRTYFREGRISPEEWHEEQAELSANLSAAKAEVARLEAKRAALDANVQQIDAEGAVVGELTAIRAMVAGQVKDGEHQGIDSFRAALRRLFERFELAQRHLRLPARRPH